MSIANHKVFLLLGGNQGNREFYLRTAKEQIAAHIGPIITESSVYSTAPWGKKDQPDFLNQVIKAETTLEPAALLGAILEIEKHLGRVRTEKNAERVIDIDILFYDDLVLHQDGLTIPHPEIQNRRFVLVPLNEIAPTFMHPFLNKPMSELLKSTGDKLKVKIQQSGK